MGKNLPQEMSGRTWSAWLVARIIDPLRNTANAAVPEPVLLGLPTDVISVLRDDLEAARIRAVESDGRVDHVTADLERVTAERDRARSGLEHEQTRADAAEREAAAQRARADALTDERNDLRDRVETLTEAIVKRPEIRVQQPETSNGKAAGGGRFSRWFFGE